MGIDYRVVALEDDGETRLEIRYIHSDAKGRHWAHLPAKVWAHDKPEFEWVLDRFREALAKPVLTAADFRRKVNRS